MRLVPDKDLTLNEYQFKSQSTVDYPDAGNNILYPTLGLIGEAGEFAEKIKKLWRNHGKLKIGSYTDEDKVVMIKELGDVMWYICAICNEFGITLNEVALVNLEKLQDRLKRNVIKSEGDNR